MTTTFRRLTCRLFGHVFIEQQRGTRLRCVMCDYQRAGYTPKEITDEQ